MPDYRWTCTSCGKDHRGLPEALVFSKPWLAVDIPMQDEDERVLDVIDNEAMVVTDARGPHFFQRAIIELPTGSQGGILQWNVWVETSEGDFVRSIREWTQASRVDRPPFTASVACRIAGYPDTLGLAVTVHERLPGTRPLLTVVGDHPLRTEQRQGITAHRHGELVELTLGRRAG